jgi:glycosyltransferase involved in cell wall biosynthesis
VPGPNGWSRRLTEYVKALSSRFQVVVLSVKTPDHTHIERFQGARLLRVPVGAGDLASRIQAFDRAVRRQLDSEEYVVCHFSDPYSGEVICELKPEHGYRVIYEAQSFPSFDLPYTQPELARDNGFLTSMRQRERRCLQGADRIITGSQVTADYIASQGVSKSRIELLRAPVDLAPYNTHSLGKPSGTPMRIVYLGSDFGFQGLVTLLKGYRRALEETELRLTLVGPDQPIWRSLLDERIDALDLNGKVELQPAVKIDDVFKVMAGSDVAVCPLDDTDRARVMGGPLAKVSEYLAAGRPIVAADLPVTRERVPASAGVFYPPGDHEALAAQLVELAKDPARRVEMGQRATHEARGLAGSVIRRKLVAIYENVLGDELAGALHRGEVIDSEAPTQIGAPLARRPGRRDEDTHMELRAAQTLNTDRLVLNPARTQPEEEEELFASEASPRRGPSPEAPRVTPPVVARPKAMLVTTEVPAQPGDHPSSGPLVRGVPLEDASAPTPKSMPALGDGWTSQLAQGYCPPEGRTFSRPAPPTNFPGREEKPTTPPALPGKRKSKT